jgi:C-terminal processing protease CtpA/Prc
LLDYVRVRALYSDKPREAVVANLDYPSPAFDAGLHEGDLIRSINGTPMEEIDRAHFQKMLSPTQPSPVTIEVSRVGKTLTFKLTRVTYAAAQASIGRVVTKSGPVPKDCDTASEKPAAPQAANSQPSN